MSLYVGYEIFFFLTDSPDDSLFGKSVKESWEASTLSFLAQNGESFMDMVCRDACDGPEIGKVRANTLFNKQLVY